MKIYFINLEDRKDRKKFFENQFDSSNLRPIRIPAITLKEDVINFAPPAVSACWLSHQLAYKKLLESNESHALIFEDDAIVKEDLIEVIQKINNINLGDLDLFQLGYLKDSNGITVDSGKIDTLHRWRASLDFCIKDKISRKKVKDTNNSEINDLKKNLGIRNPLLKDSFEAGAHCYIISQKLARELVDYNINPIIISADLLLIEVANSKKFKCVRVSKSFCLQDSSLGSNILLRSRKNLSHLTSGLN